MCGITGFVGAGTRGDLHRMNEAVRHRGPDGEGFHIDEELGVHLGHRRLAIVDIDGGHQPMWNEDHTVCVIFNGEIYNHVELRDELVRLGHRFASDHSDSEVLVHGFEQWGEGLAERLNGMFAFAILDRGRKQLFLARDRFGEKPLYFSQSGPGQLVFASELSAIAQHPSVSRSFNQAALKKLFAWGYLPAPNTVLSGVEKLPGGHSLTLDLQSGRAERRCYWRFALEPDEGLSDADEPRLVEELTDLLGQAAHRRLMSDVPLGVFLSGGLDSSSVLGVLARKTDPSEIATFTIGFNEASFDESAYARTVAEHFGTRHNERLLDMAGARELIPELLGRLDEPLGDGSLLPTYLLSEFTREKVTVALTGDGGDELFAGYDPFLALGPSDIYQRFVPGVGHRGLRRLADMLPISDANMSFDFKLRRTLMGLSYGPQLRLPVWMAPLEITDLRDLFESEVRPEEVYAEAIELWERRPELSTVDRALEFFTTFYLQDDILTKSDRAAMMCSLEARAVFLDNDLVEFARKLPSRFKMKGRDRKYLLKKAARELLPASIVDRKKKGFGIPLAKWLREVPAEPPMGAVDGLSLDWARKAWTAHRNGGGDYRFFLWSWLGVQAFADQYVGSS